MNRIETAPTATLLRFPAARQTTRSTPAPSRRDVERAIARGRRLQGEALQDAFRRLFRVMVGGCSLRSLRLPGELPAGRQGCC